MAGKDATEAEADDHEDSIRETLATILEPTGQTLELLRTLINRPARAGRPAPQGGPLSPLLSNLVLDDLDKELTRRGHCSCRYADDRNIYVRSRRAGERVMASVSRFLTQKLRLKVRDHRSRTRSPR